ncbi:splicing factor 3B subunit 1-like isoform X3 [Ostrea edulis]|uniref:splicing factor 3B subunit 1-like isoform X3 n=1 Tax=Ostrea edulis TaxID=37623 RepID=UPI0024AF386D|nr:splicing factor 3B subunit 1-like isoform X3 [Ostrea edulis]
MAALTREAIEEEVRNIQNKKKALESKGVELDEDEEMRVGLGSAGHYDRDIYSGGKTSLIGYDTSIAASEERDDEEDASAAFQPKLSSYTAPLNFLNDTLNDKDFDPMQEHRPQRIRDREGTYRAQLKNRIISPERYDPFADGGKTPDVNDRTFAKLMMSSALDREKDSYEKQLKEKAKAGELRVVNGSDSQKQAAAAAAEKKKRRWDQATDDSSAKKAKTTWDAAETPSNTRWDETPGRKTGAETPGATPGQSTRMWDATPGHLTPGATTPGRDATPGHQNTPSARRNRWDETPRTERETPGHGSGWAETPKTDRGGDLIQDTPTPGASKRRSRWDETPGAHTPSMTPSAMTPSMTPGNQTPGGSTPSGFTPGGSTPSGFTPGGITPSGTTPTGPKAMAMATPTPGHLMSMTPEQLQAYTWQREIDERNRPLSDDELDSLFPPGYKVLQPPAGYIPIRTPARKLIATPTPMAGTPVGFKMQTPDSKTQIVDMQPKGNLPMMKPDDMQYFDKLLVEVDEETLSPEEQKERKIMKLLLKIKNGTPPMRKAALRQITDKAREFGAGPLFNQILPLLMSPTLEDQERHLLVKVIDRILYKLDDLVRPYVHKILVVIEPLLIDEDYYARVEGREIISNLAKAAGLATMISTMRPDIDNMDEYVRNTTARAFAVVASALGIPSLLPFLKAVCKSKKSWQARHTGIKIVQQIAILMGCAILPHLKNLVEIIEHGLVDEQQKVRTITALALAALAEAATPYGIESFDSVLKPLWKGIRQHRGKGLAAFLKAIGYLIPLMDAEYANYYTREVMLILKREFQSPDEEMKKIVLKVVKQCCATDGVAPQYIKDEILPPFFKHFWNQRMALDRRNYRQLVDTTVEIANKVGAAEIIQRIVDDLKDEAEQYRKMVMETIEKIMGNLGAADIDSRLEEQLIDGILYAFQEQTTEDVVMLNGFGTVVNALGKRVKPYLPQICGTILWRLNNKSAKVRQQAADLISRIAIVMKTCQEERLMGHLGVVLYEYLGEEYPEVLGSILGALKAIVNVIGMTKMTPPIKDLLPRLTPILKNRHEKVQENCIDLVGRIADRGAEYVSAREWMRICFELLELLKAHKKAIRRATVNTFGYIAKAIGPHDVLVTLRLTLFYIISSPHNVLVTLRLTLFILFPVHTMC